MSWEGKRRRRKNVSLVEDNCTEQCTSVYVTILYKVKRGGCTEMEDYKLLTAETAITYIKEKTDIFSKTDMLVAKKISGDRQSADGYCNILIVIKSITTLKSVVLKQILPYVRALKEKGVFLPLSLKRVNAEVNYIELLNKVIPEGVPKIYLWDEGDSILIMEDLSSMNLLRTELINMKKFPELPRQLGAFLGKSTFYTSELFLNYNEKIALEDLFNSENTENLFEQLIFDGVILADKTRTIYLKLQKDLDEFCATSAIIKEVKELKDIFVNKKQCLNHTDLHSSNIFVDENKMKVFDSEFARYGPISFDLGRLIGSILLNYASLIGMKEIVEDKKTDYQDYLLEMIKEIYNEFEKNFTALKEKNANGECNNYHVNFLLEETIGFAACVSMTRIYDDALSFDFKRIKDIEERTKGQRLVIKLAKQMLLKRKEFNTIEDVVKEIKESTLRYVVSDLIEEAFDRPVVFLQHLQK